MQFVMVNVAVFGRRGDSKVRPVCIRPADVAPGCPTALFGGFGGASVVLPAEAAFAWVAPAGGATGLPAMAGVLVARPSTLVFWVTVVVLDEVGGALRDGCLARGGNTANSATPIQTDCADITPPVRNLNMATDNVRVPICQVHWHRQLGKLKVRAIDGVERPVDRWDIPKPKAFTKARVFKTSQQQDYISYTNLSSFPTNNATTLEYPSTSAQQLTTKTEAWSGCTTNPPEYPHVSVDAADKRYIDATEDDLVEDALKGDGKGGNDYETHEFCNMFDMY
ncbi:hypothetical protein LZ30DRAFT_693940 [Colletotrichum cereale]|nr:hypothetical protein LZ30DRAFT_693940 [Colletotrichum cereale]